MHRFLLVLGIAMCLLGIGCSESNFAGEASKNRKQSQPESDDTSQIDLGSDSNQSKPNRPDGSDEGKNEGHDDRLDSNGNESIVDDQVLDSAGLSEDEITRRKQICLFAVSGGWVGANTIGVHPNYTNWGSVFPNTISGNVPAHGERFDDVGGVFLQARSAPYVAGEGDKELDRAIEMTFDTIAIPPGMKVEIYADDGRLLITDEGPFIGEAGVHATYTAAYLTLLRSSGMLTGWMKDHVETLDVIPIINSLQSARKVLVETIPGGFCDQW